MVDMKKILLITIMSLSIGLSPLLTISSYTGLAHAQSITDPIDDSDGCVGNTCDNGNPTPPLYPSNYPSLDQSSPQQPAIINQLNSAASNLNLSTNQYLNGNGGKQKLVISGYDLGALQTCFATPDKCKIDRRTLASLEYLVTDAGHDHIKVDRIIKNYGNDSQDKSKETDYADKGGESAINLSAHAEGKSYDISEIDTYTCTNSDGSKTPPKPILVAWQDKAPGQNLGDPAVPGSSTQVSIANNYAKIGTSFFNSSVINGINGATSLNIPTNITNLSTGSSIPDIITMLGQANLQSNFGLGTPIVSQGNLNDTATALGRSILASGSNLDPAAFVGSNKNDLLKNLSKTNLAQQIGLVPNSFSGNTVNDWITGAGVSSIENTLGLRAGSITANRQSTGLNGVAQAKIESVLDLATNSWSNNLDKISQNNNNQSILTLIQTPASNDRQLGIPSGSTSNLINGKISPDSFVSLVAQSIKANYIDHYNGGSNADLAWNAPTGTMNNLASGNSLTAYRSLGAKALGDALQLPQDQITNLINQAKTGIVNKIDVSRSPANTSLSSDDFINIFNNATSNSVQLTDGQSILDNVIKHTNQDFYTGLTTDSLNKLSDSQSINDYVRNLGLNQLESDFGLDSGSLNNIINSKSLNSDTLVNILGQSNVDSVVKQLNLDLQLNNLPSLYQVDSNDVIQLLTFGRTDTIAQKSGSEIFGQTIGSQPGYVQDALFGRSSFDDIFANATLKNIAQSIGINVLPTTNNQSLINILQNNLSSINNQSFISSLGIDSNNKYNLSLDSITKGLKTGDYSSLVGDLSKIGSESIAAKLNLPSESIAQINNNQQSAQAYATDLAIGSLEKNLGLPSGTISNTYLKNQTNLQSVLNIAGQTIMDKTGIGVLSDAERFLNGDLIGGIKATSIAQTIKSINDGQTDPAALVSYSTLANAIFNNPASIQSQVTSILSTKSINSTDLATINTATRLASQSLQQDANFALVDSQLSKTIPGIPANFTKTLMTGTTEQKGLLVKNYASNLGATLLSDQELSSLTGLPIPAGTTASIIAGTFDASAFGTTLLNSPQTFNWMDSALGLPGGTSSTLYAGYKQYTNLTSQFAAGNISSTQFKAGEAQLAITVADQLTGGAISGAVNKITSPIDGALGLPAGSTLQIGLSIASGNYLGAGLMLASALGIDLGGIFGGLGGLGGLFGGFGGLGGGTTCPDLQKLARQKVREVESDVMAKAVEDKKNNADNDLIPSQILTWRQADIDYLNQKYPEIYGPTGRFGNAGISITVNPQNIHVGF